MMRQKGSGKPVRQRVKTRKPGAPPAKIFKDKKKTPLRDAKHKPGIDDLIGE